MPTPDQIRLDADRRHPRILDLWWALRPLTSVIRFMQSGAHPDDEISPMLAALAFRDGINLSYVCATRGEGGQNDIGTEAGADLGALRTREMERACGILGMRLYWLGQHPEDPVTDFGFSKSGGETLGKWGHARTLSRFVEIVRTEQPDILCPTFLDVPGQHGHHRAMTRAAHEVMAAAGDPEYPSNLPVWQVKKLYLPAWSGAGAAYDDDAPPPPATLAIDGAGGDPVSGWNWARIGQQSRAFHRTQGMGRWVPPGEGRNWPLHLAESHVPGPDTALAAGLPATLADLAALPGAGAIAADLAAAGAAVDRAVAAYPRFADVAAAAADALAATRRAGANCPGPMRGELLHRLDAKQVQLGHVLRLALGIEARGRVGEVFLTPGQDTALTLELGKGAADKATLLPDLPQGWHRAEGTLSPRRDAAMGDPYRASFDPAAPPAPALLLRFSTHGEDVGVRLPFEAEPMAVPSPVAPVAPNAAVVNLATARREIAVRFTGVSPEGAEATLDLPCGWRAETSDTGVLLALPAKVAPGLYRLPVHVGGCQAFSLHRIDHPHISPTARAAPTVLRIRVLTAELPDVRIGYVGGGNDRVGHWLAAMGADVTELADADLAGDGALARFDTIVVGIFAMRFRAGLAAAMPRLHRWIEAGGTLLTLYHRPWDNWDPHRIPPRRIEIGQPSLRWRVTDETAPVRQLEAHELLSTPNRIGAEDWAGWAKERGLYFARNWDRAYRPLLEMADPGEDPHRGILLVADLGKGRHIHCALTLHHQMENLVPGAFRLMANLLARRR
ncbi:PIG-L family deacetylase [Tropicimonas sp.]|uniref:PIG-L family deacetylase n=1 Tax=Tropicimonas sp. TaxID=2067044 RepID=UPI003A8886F0